MSVRILVGDCRDRLKELPDESVHCVVTSPPYWGLRDYGIPPTIWGGNDACDHEWIERGVVVQSGGTGEASAKQVTNAGTQGSVQKPIKTGFCKWCAAWRGSFGLEPTYQLFVDHAVEVFAELRRVLKRDGTLWLNLGDSYASGEIGRHDGGRTFQDTYDRKSFGERKQARRPAGIKPKNLVGIPWRAAFALQADGWWLRQDIIWSKPNPMPESVTDRCTKAHEYLFLLSKSERYWFDQDAIAEPVSTSSGGGARSAEIFMAVHGLAAAIDPIAAASRMKGRATNGVCGKLPLSPSPKPILPPIRPP